MDNYIDNIDLNKLIKNINNYNPHILGISFSQYSLKEVKYILNNIKDNSMLICAGGIFPTLANKELLKDIKRLDCIILGDGEVPFFNIVDLINKNQNWQKTKGICCQNNKFYINPPSPIIKNLDILPFPDRTLTKKILFKYPIAISGSRGCPWSKCTFCCVNSLNKKLKYPNWRPRSIINIVDELEFLINKFNYNRFNFVDDCFFGYGKKSKKRTLLFINELKKRKLKISYSLDCRIDQVQEDMLRKLKISGLFKIYFGIESFHNDSMKRINKGFNKEDILKALKICYKLGLKVNIGFIPFSYDSSLEEIKENLLFLKKIKGYHIGLFVNILTPLYNTELFKDLKSRYKLNGNKFSPNTLWKHQKASKVYEFMLYYDKIIKEIIDKAPYIWDSFKVKKYLKKIHINYSMFIINTIQNSELNKETINKWIEKNLYTPTINIIKSQKNENFI